MSISKTATSQAKVCSVELLLVFLYGLDDSGLGPYANGARVLLCVRYHDRASSATHPASCSLVTGKPRLVRVPGGWSGWGRKEVDGIGRGAVHNLSVLFHETSLHRIFWDTGERNVITVRVCARARARARMYVHRNMKGSQ